MESGQATKDTNKDSRLVLGAVRQGAVYVSIKDIRKDTEADTYYVRANAPVYDSSYPDRALVSLYYGLYDLTLSRALDRLVRVDSSNMKSDEIRIEFVERTRLDRLLRRFFGRTTS